MRRQVNDRLRLLPPADLAALAAAVGEDTGHFDVPDRVKALVKLVTERSGVVLETLPPAAPSAARGRAMFTDNCAGCHGARGAGDGPDARRGEMTPADFTSAAFMRRETPRDFAAMIGLGHRRRGMPEWAQSLSLQQRWDLVAFIWGLQRSDADRTAGARTWKERCAACHGPTGAGVPDKAADLTRPGSLADRNDRTRALRATLPAAARRRVGAQRHRALAGRRARARPQPGWRRLLRS